MAAPNLPVWRLAFSVATELLPIAAAWSAGRLRAGDPAGQVGRAWAFMVACTLVQTAGAVTGGAASPLVRWGVIVAGIALPLLLVPPLLTWIGADAKRRQPAVLAAFAVAGVGTLAALGPGREYTLLSRITAHAALAGLVLLMMARRFRRDADPQAAGGEPGWAWISGGLLLYCLATLLGRALVEALVGRSWAGVNVAGMAIQTAYGLSMLAMAWGIRRSTPARARPLAPPAGTPLPGAERMTAL